MKKSYDYLKRLDFYIYVIDGKNIDIETYKIWKKQANKYNIGHIVVINKIDTLNKDEINNIKNLFENPIFISVKENKGIDKLKEELIKSLEQEEEDKPIVGDLLPYGSKVVLVVPIDSEAPKGRIILPQVQVIRDCLDHGIKTYVVRDTELSQALTDLKDIDLVITDSQAFKEVESIIPSDMKLTSFSILFARQKGEIRDFLEGTKKLDSLKPGDKILICESCTHNVSHEDIGRVKIPNMLKKIAGGDLIIDYKVGYDFKENVEDYDLIIHCGACMVNRKSILNKIEICKEKDVSITNYGMVIAYFTGILNRAVNIF
ncbi:MAG: [FeFe] hydrogenase H-cluster maturation GTPase HydF [Citrobacter freundii]|nr:[FeFe] hydrogenase H-cluster maturation GTPase HydF [Citrobacter freundii]